MDDTFFFRHMVTHLRDQYSNIGPDFLFDPANFDRQQWARVEPLVVETSRPEEGAGVTVTAMDYGAAGRLRVFVHSAECGDWQPVPIKFGTAKRAFLNLPLDEDNNLMADAREEYRGIDSGADTDAEPRGNGMPGDGLSAFEEYRGFMVRGGACPGEVVGALSPEPSEEEPIAWGEEHIRTPPHHKNLFVHTPDPELAVMLEGFAWSTDLSVHGICEPRYVNNDTRIVNFTLQNAGLRTWNGHTISQPEPQHGLWVQPVEELEGNQVGVAVPMQDGAMGPPKLTRGIAIVKPAPVAPVEGMDRRLAQWVSRGGNSLQDLEVALRHELGHAVGVPHHGDDVLNWKIQSGRLNVTPLFSPIQIEGGAPDFSIISSLAELQANAPSWLLVSPGQDCKEDDERAVYRDGKFAGCLTQQIVRRGQQNSGKANCPMRYGGAEGDYYEAPGSTASYVWSGEVVRMGYSNYSGPVERERYFVDEWTGTFLKYRPEYEPVRLDHFCESIMGTGLNALPGKQNHAGDAGRSSHKPCRDYIVVNDMAARNAP